MKDKIGAKYKTRQENIIEPSRIFSPKTTSPLQKSILILMHHPDISIDENLLNDSRIENNTGVILLKSIFNLIKKNPDINMGRIIENFREEKLNYNSLEKN